MPDSQPIYEGSTHRVWTKLHHGENGTVIIRIGSLEETEKLPVWKSKSTKQLDDLMSDLGSEFGKEHVRVKRVNSATSTDREITITPKAGAQNDLPKQVQTLLESFIADRSMELETVDEEYFRDLVRNAAKQKLQPAIKSIIQNQMLDTDQKTDAIMDVLRIRRDERRGR